MANSTKAIGQAVLGLATVAAAATTDLGALTKQRAQITSGASTISSFGTRANCVRHVVLAAAVTLVPSSALVVPGGQNLVLGTGDSFWAMSDASGNWSVFGVQRASGSPPVGIRGHIAGLTLSNNAGTPNTKVDIAAGQASNTTGRVVMTLASSITVDLGAVGANGLDAGSIAANTWYHVYLIGHDDGTCAGLASSADPATGPTLPSGYTYRRRLGSVKTNGSSQIIAFIQKEDVFWWSSGGVVDANAMSVTTTTVGGLSLLPLTVPTGVVVRPILRAVAAAGHPIILSDPDLPDVAPTTNMGTPPGFDINASTFGLPVELLTNTSAQIRARCTDASGVLSIETKGWRDSRGRFA